MELHSAADIPRRNTFERAIKYVKNAKYGGVDRLIKGKPLLTWGLRWIFYQLACLSEFGRAQCRIFSEAEYYTTGDQICQIWKYRGYRKTNKGEIFKWAIFGITMKYGNEQKFLG